MFAEHLPNVIYRFSFIMGFDINLEHILYNKSKILVMFRYELLFPIVHDLWQHFHSIYRMLRVNENDNLPLLLRNEVYLHSSRGTDQSSVFLYRILYYDDE